MVIISTKYIDLCNIAELAATAIATAAIL